MGIRFTCFLQGCGMICPRKLPKEALSSGDRTEDTNTQYNTTPPDKADVSNNCDLTIPQKPIRTIEPCPKLGDAQSGDQQYFQEIDLLLQKAGQYEERRQWENAIQSLESCLFLLKAKTNEDTDAHKSAKVSTAVRIAWLKEFCGQSNVSVLESWVHAMRLARAYDEQKLSFVCARRVLHHACCLHGDTNLNEILADLHRTAESQESGQYKGALLNGIGLVYMRTGDYLKALNAFQTALNCIVHYSPNTRASLWQNLGTAYSAMGRRELAVEALITALKLYRRKSMYEGEAQACYNLGCVLSAIPSKNSLAR
ncbi:tetratricopeptide repeat protein, partial [Opisthorchis viverrini]